MHLQDGKGWVVCLRIIYLWISGYGVIWYDPRTATGLPILSNTRTCQLWPLQPNLSIARSWCLKHHTNENLTFLQVQLESELACKRTEQVNCFNLYIKNRSHVFLRIVGAYMENKAVFPVPLDFFKSVRHGSCPYTSWPPSRLTETYSQILYGLHYNQVTLLSPSSEWAKCERQRGFERVTSIWKL
jgi:hypothetical protein